MPTTTTPEHDKPEPAWKRAARQADPRTLWRQLRANPRERTLLALAVAVGVFVSTLPAYGYQTLLAFFLARRFRLNPLASVVGSHLSTPPVGQFQWIASIWLGHLLLTGSFMRLSDLDPGERSLAQVAGWTLVEWTVGGVVLGVVLAAAGFLLLVGVLRLVPLKRPDADPGATDTRDVRERNR